MAYVTGQLKILNDHQIVGLDLDGTLINGKRSAYLKGWCNTYHADKKLHIITFRTDGFFRQWKDDLLNFGYRAEWFVEVHGIPTNIWSAYSEATRFFKGVENNPRKLERKRMEYGLSERDLDDFIAAIRECYEWKGKHCQAIGATVLVDDVPNAVTPGCDKYGIQFIDSATL